MAKIPKMTQRLIDELRRRNITLFASPNSPPRVGASVAIGDSFVWETDCRVVGPFMPQRMGAFSYTQSPLHSICSVGRYCSLGGSIKIMYYSHPTHWASTSPFAFDLAAPGASGYMRRQGVETPTLHSYDHLPGPIRIGNDVWIGDHVLLKPGIVIGDGSVVGAGSVVTKDVPPYAIVGGAPAKLIRYRFEPELIERFIASAWWRFGPDHLAGLQVPEPSAFLDGVDNLIAQGVNEARVGRVTGRQLLEWCSTEDEHVEPSS